MSTANTYAGGRYEAVLSVPSAARVYDCLLGGLAHTLPDRALAARVGQVAPWAAWVARLHRMFLWRMVRSMSEAGVGQFLDLCPAIYSRGNVHEIIDDTRVVFVEHDPVAYHYAVQRLASYPHAAVVLAGRDPQAVFRHADASRLLDLSRPVGLLMAGGLLAAGEDPGRLVAAWRSWLPTGSQLAISHLTCDHAPPPVRGQVAALIDAYEMAGEPIAPPRSREEITAWLDGMQLLPPGVTHLTTWCPDAPDVEGPARWLGYGALARQR